VAAIFLSCCCGTCLKQRKSDKFHLFILNTVLQSPLFEPQFRYGGSVLLRTSFLPTYRELSQSCSLSHGTLSIWSSWTLSKKPNVHFCILGEDWEIHCQKNKRRTYLFFSLLSIQAIDDIV
jgi:hypothetical protein